jgi:hypothetical protein
LFTAGESQSTDVAAHNQEPNLDLEKPLGVLGPVPDIDERRLMWKIDLHLVPPLCILYLLAFLDRVNIANAKLYNLTTDLGLVGNQYNIALVLFFVPYVVFEIPANMLLKKFRPSIWCINALFATVGKTDIFSAVDYVLLWACHDSARTCYEFCWFGCNSIFPWSL